MVTEVEGDLREQLADLVRGFSVYLRRHQRRGGRWVCASPSRSGTGDEPRAAIGDEPRGADGADDRSGHAGVSTLEQVRGQLGECTRCGLHASRSHLVFGAGSPGAELVFVGEAPGADEDRQGQPFVGKAGQLLTRMIEAMGLSREDVYITNILKCRPPRNRDPESEEVAACADVLRQQIETIAPSLIVSLGNFATRTLLRTDAGISSLRGRFHDHGGIGVMPTFHPSYLLRNPEAKRAVWNDLQQVMAQMDRLGLHRRR